MIAPSSAAMRRYSLGIRDAVRFEVSGTEYSRSLDEPNHVDRGDTNVPQHREVVAPLCASAKCRSRSAGRRCYHHFHESCQRWMMVSICGSDHFREFFGGVGRHSFPLKAIGCSKTQLLA